MDMKQHLHERRKTGHDQSNQKPTLYKAWKRVQTPWDSKHSNAVIIRDMPNITESVKASLDCHTRQTQNDGVDETTGCPICTPKDSTGHAMGHVGMKKQYIARHNKLA